MSRSVIIDNKPDLFVYPPLDQNHPVKPGAQFTIGDLHGNALKFIYFLVRENILHLTSEEYQLLANIYQTPTNRLTHVDLDSFNSILKNAKVNTNAYVRLIGDELADRGENDYFTLKIFEKLGKSKLSICILFSNHGGEFLRSYENNFDVFDTILGYGQGRSFNNLGILVEQGLVQIQELNDIVKKYYLPNLKLIDYTINSSTQITLYTHAPVGLRTIQALAKELHIVFKDNDVDELANTIDEMNRVSRELGREFHRSRLDESTMDPTYAPVQFPLIRLAWTRRSMDELIEANHHIDPMQPDNNGYKIIYVHGHDGVGMSLHPEYVINLDNTFGKGEYRRGQYSIEYSYPVKA